MDFNGGTNGPTQEQMDKFKKLGSRFGVIFGILLFVFILGTIGIKWFTDYIWMDSLDFGTVFTTIFTTKILLGVAGFILFTAITYVTLFWIKRSYTTHFDPHQLPALFQQKKAINWIITGIALFIGIIGSLTVQGLGWEPALKLMNHVSFGETDPFFNMDISFYMFLLPFLNFIVNLLLSLAVFVLIAEVLAYSVFHMYRMSRSAQTHLGVTVLIVGILIALTHLLEPFETLLTNHVNLFQESVVHGLSFTDRLVNIPASYILAAFAIIAAIWVIVALRKGKLQAILTPVVIYFALIILGQGASVVVQNFVVSPNEYNREAPYLQHNLDFTRAAYDLENMEEKEHPGNTESLDEDLLERNALTINNVRINDARPLLDIYNQLQTFRTYYQFNDIDIDRYEIDGEYQQVFIGARELNTVDLPEQAQTWVNQNLRYTHGYGVAMSQVNDVTSQGQPEYLVRNLPPQGELDITRPQIYFGEEDYDSVIVDTEVDEFDYPAGEENVTNRYEEEAGIPLSGLNRLLFAMDEGSFRILVSGQITGDSKLLQTRNIMDRVNRIAPFFEYDEDPYVFVRDDGSLAWMLDAYLIEEGYPYAESYEGRNNYIKNPVKVVVDAYTGEVDFYITDPDEPLVQTYQNMFPELFTEEIPDDVRSHFRYPERLFKVEAEMFGTYHMTNLELFYNREDYWQFPTERYYSDDIEMNPYYMTMKLPEYDEEEFILMMPYTPRNRQNMIAWIGVRNDGEHYGEKIVYRFPKQENVYGPQQIENRINQDPVISQELNLWSQGGSSVIRGNLLAVPIEDTILYVEPIYIESSNETSLPEVKQVILAYGDYIVMEATFDDALDELMRMVDSGVAPEQLPEADGDDPETGDGDVPGETEDGTEGSDDAEGEAGTEAPILNADETLQELSDRFNAYQDALAEGNWQEAAEIMTEIENMLE
ncbi:UPF0182 family protein [Oceanobacillus bengalensis]|uniref:UPF0182 protein D8M05_12215 n=1 Tax=Oceanobacillus bengalensis TaxID=1435466 RepID=A0A494YX50_9BACI|nr:UPF0182 family protein [Oceanobacillus bengalensis]RKQ14801.1 UPF0182 family protein [Oceanobacillus bengalensis]